MHFSLVRYRLFFIHVDPACHDAWQHQQHKKASDHNAGMSHQVPPSEESLTQSLTHLIGIIGPAVSSSKQLASLGTMPSYPFKVFQQNVKRPPGNRAASSLGRIVPTEAKPSELSGEILCLAK
jgi:hypothetical protein